MPYRLGVLVALVSTALLPLPLRGQELNELLDQTQAALAETDSFEALANAAREAYEANGKALELALAAFDAELPPEPTPVEEYTADSLVEVERLHAENVAYAGALAARDRGLTDARERLSARLRLLAEWKDKERLLTERATAARETLQEVLKRVERGELEAVEGDIDASARLTQIDAILSARPAPPDTESAQEQVAALQTRADALTAPDAEDLRDRLIRRSASEFLLAVVQFAEADRAQYESLEPGVLLTGMDDAGRKLDDARVLYAPLREDLRTKYETLQQLDAEREALEAPSRESYPDSGEGHAKLRHKRADLSYEEALLEFNSRRADLLARTETAVEELLAGLDEGFEALRAKGKPLLQLHTYQTVAEQMAADGRLEMPPLEPENRRDALWMEAIALTLDEARRLRLVEELEERLASLPDLEAARRQVAQQAERVGVAREALQEELGWADLVGEMEGLGDAELVALVDEQGELGQQLVAALGEVAEELDAWTHLESDIDVELLRLDELDTPFAQIEVGYDEDRGQQVSDELSIAGESSAAVLPTDHSTDRARLKAIVEQVRNQGPKTSEWEGKIQPTPEELDHLRFEQREARRRLAYFDLLQEGMEGVRQDVETLRLQADERLETLAEVARLERRRHAAAAELVARRDGGRLELEVAQLPPEVETWADRAVLDQTETERAMFRARRMEDEERSRASLERLAVFLHFKTYAELGGETAQEKVALISVPEVHIKAARTEIADLRDFERENLEYLAGEQLNEEESPANAFLSTFASKELTERFEQPLRAAYLELVDLDRIDAEYALGAEAFAELAVLTEDYRSGLEGALEAVRQSEQLRTLEYHMARFLAATAAQPAARISLSARFRTTYGEPLVFPEDVKEWDLLLWTNRLLTAEARLWGDKRWIETLKYRLSPAGIETEIGRYRAAITQIESHREELADRRRGLQAQIDDLWTDYGHALEAHALRTAGKVATIPIAAMLAVFLLRKLILRIKRRSFTPEEDESGERARRLSTISDVGGKSITVVVWVIAGIYILGSLGLDVTPIVASASVAGLAVAFGAQALIRDYFAGFNILLENQFTVGDVVDVGTAAGTVEQMSLRVTVLRDIKGVVHYVPNGQIQRVSNKTKGWSRVVLEVGVAYGEDIDRVIGVLKDILHDMKTSEPWSQRILEEPEVAGVQTVVESTVSVRIMVKVKPGQQWSVQRELLARIKRRFDQEGIKAPYQHRVVHHVNVDGDGRPVGPQPAPETERVVDR